MSEALAETTDADAPLDPPPLDRTISPIAIRFGDGRRGKLMVLAALVAGCSAFAFATWREEPPNPDHAHREPARQVVRFEPLRSKERPPTLAEPGPKAPSLSTTQVDPEIPALQPVSAAAPADGATRAQAQLAATRAAPMMVFSRTPNSPNAPWRVQDDAAQPDAGGEGAPGALDQLLRSAAVARARATRLPDRNFLILAGANIPCILQTSLESSTPGYVSCLIPRDVFSDNGAVVLLEKGAKVLGEYRSGMRQGQTRLFVLWKRVVTPAGVAIDLASPASDPLGRAGVDGVLDKHFWDRFGGALLLSIVDDGAYAAAGHKSDLGVARLPSDAAALALQNSLNVPPSVRLSQGSEMSIFVAQDLDFSGVYSLKAR